METILGTSFEVPKWLQPLPVFETPLKTQVLLAVDDGERSVLVDLSNVTCPEEALSLDGHPILLGSPMTKKRGCVDCSQLVFLFNRT